MRAVNISELKNNLSAFLAEVKGGEEILIRDRNLPIAKIIPISLAEDFNAELLKLASEGKVRLPEKTLPELFWTKQAPSISMTKIVKALRRDRDEE